MKLHPNQGQSLKPSQVGVLISTYSMIDMVTELLENGHELIYSSKYSQNALENLFSVYDRYLEEDDDKLNKIK